jgi:hypothetical protein
MVNKDLVRYKNRNYSLLKLSGYYLKKAEVFGSGSKEKVLALPLSDGILFQIEILYDRIEETGILKEKIRKKILTRGLIFKEEIKQLPVSKESALYCHRTHGGYCRYQSL